MDLRSHSRVMTFLENIPFKKIPPRIVYRLLLTNLLSPFLKKENFHANFTFLNNNYSLKL